MQAVLLMAGKGTRMAQDYDGPKHLLPVAGKKLIDHVLDSLPAEVDELIFVVGGPHEQKIRDYFSSNETHGRPITFVVQAEQLGLAHAFSMAKDLLKGRWLGMVSDDLFSAKTFKEMMTHDLAVMAYHVEKPEMFGVLVADDEGYLVKSVEKPKEFVSNLASCGVMLMDESFFEVDVPPSDRGEYETPDVWMKLIQERGAKIKVVEADFWLPINDKAQLDEAERILSDQK